MHMKVWHKTAQCFFSIETHQSVKRWKYYAPRKGFIGVLSDIVPIGASSGLSGCQQRAVCSCFGFEPGTHERRIFQVQHIKLYVTICMDDNWGICCTREQIHLYRSTNCEWNIWYTEKHSSVPELKR